MKFIDVPEHAEKARPWAMSATMHAPPGLEDKVSSVEAQVDDVETDLGRAFRVYVEVDADELEELRRGGCIEFSVYSSVLPPVSAQVVTGS